MLAFPLLGNVLHVWQIDATHVAVVDALRIGFFAALGLCVTHVVDIKRIPVVYFHAVSAIRMEDNRWWAQRVRVPSYAHACIQGVPDAWLIKADRAVLLSDVTLDPWSRSFRTQRD